MVKTYKYHLDKTSKKFRCPGCGQKRLVKYIDAETNGYVDDNVGRCDREANCGYHMPPKEFFAQNPQETKKYNNNEEPVRQVTTEISYLPIEILDVSVTRHPKCNLYPFLVKKFRENVASSLCKEYFIGASKEGNTAFWQVDRNGRVRQAKVMQYSSETGRRNKDTGAFFAGKTILNSGQANFQQCFFGEYQLSYPGNQNKPIAIVESEKTAAIASVYYPNFIWLATGGKHGAKWTEQNVCKVLKGRKVILFPDLGAHDTWVDKASLLAKVAGCKVAVSNTLKQIATENEMQSDYDIADYLLQNKDSSGLALTDDGYPVIWDYSFN